MEFLTSLFSKPFGRDIGEFVSKRFYIIPSFIVFFIISFIDTNIISIGTFPEEWKLSIRQPIADTVKSLTVNPGFIAFYKRFKRICLSKSIKSS